MKMGEGGVAAFFGMTNQKEIHWKPHNALAHGDKVHEITTQFGKYRKKRKEKWRERKGGGKVEVKRRERAWVSANQRGEVR